MKNIRLLFLLLCFSTAYGQRNTTISGQRANTGVGTASLVHTPTAYGTYQRTITVDNTGNTESLLHNQLKVQLTSANFDFSHANSDGSDIRFVSGTGVTLNYWIESYSSISQTATIWVKCHDIASAGSGTIILYYGTPGATAQSSFQSAMRSPQIDATTLALYRFSEGSGTTSANASVFGNPITLSSGAAWSTTPQGSGAITTNGTTGYAAVDGLLNHFPPEGTIAFSFWIFSNVNPANSANQRLFSKWTHRNSDVMDCYFQPVTGKLTLRCSNGGINNKYIFSTDSTWSAGTRYHITATWNQKWLFFYINGVLQGKVETLMPFDGDGFSRPFTLGCLDNTTRQLFSNAQFDNLVIYSRQVLPAEALALAECRSYYQKDEASKWQKGVFPAYTTGWSGRETTHSEGSLFYEGGVFKMWHSMGSDASEKRIAYATSTDLITWDKSSQSGGGSVLGGGAGGITNANRSYMFKEGSTYYLYHVETNSFFGSAIYVSTSTDGITFSGSSVAMTVQGTGVLGYHNHCVIKNGSTYYLMAESDLYGTSSRRYEIRVGTSTSPLGPFTVVANPTTQMAYNSGGVSGPHIVKINGKYEIWTHQAPSGVLPTEICRITATDLLNPATYVKTYTEPTISITEAYSYDQNADPFVMEANGHSYMVYEGVDNRSTLINYGQFAYFPGTLSQLVTDLTYSIGVENPVLP